MLGISRRKKISYVVNLAIVILLYVVFTMLIRQGVVNSYYSDIINMMCINIIMAVSLNLVTGLLGQLVLGHAGFMLVGAYAAGLFTLHSGLPLPVAFPIALVLGGLVAALFGVIIGVPALRLKGDYLAIITLGFGEIIRVIANNLTITNGAKGLYGIDSLNSRHNLTAMFTYMFFIAVLTIFISFTFGTSRHGRAVISIREDEIAAEASGINTTYYKLLAFILAAFFAGVAGGLYAHQIGLIDPSKFDFNRSVEILVMVVLGGMGSITGSIISAGVLTVLPEALRGFASYRMLLYSIVLICVMLFRPTGLLGRSEFSLMKTVDKIKGAVKGKKQDPASNKEG
ncbi:branched-chain amino acid ABC transporter permease [Caproiciproducens sp. R2]|uniref:branched-chain amino acid ABC transporter permease n=1 Tax=Caproiciproducens sp. R2 TaxID=3435187 RepID=UPI004033DF11